MSMIMFVIGCIAIMAGAGMVAFGIPVNEFSFGNTMILSGVVLATGGLIVIALSAVIKEIQRLNEATAHAPAPPAAAPEAFEAPAEARPMPARVPFPAKPAMREPVGERLPAMADEAEETALAAPSLRNPEAPQVEVEDEVSLSPQYPAAAEKAHEPALEAPWRPTPPPAPPPREPSSYFDSMWPAKPRTSPRTSPRPAEPAGEPRPDTKAEPKFEPELSSRDTIARAASPEAEAETSKAAVLKSGVVDGMPYTLYVDGSIEAELPQGMLHFASIDELRSHLEKNG